MKTIHEKKECNASTTNDIIKTPARKELSGGKSYSRNSSENLSKDRMKNLKVKMKNLRLNSENTTGKVQNDGRRAKIRPFEDGFEAEVRSRNIH